MEKYLDVLRKCTLFTKMKDENLLRILSCLEVKVESFYKKETILAEGTPARCMGILLSGSASIFQTDYNGNRNLLSVIKPSEIFAEAFSCAETSALPVTVIANEYCEIMLIQSTHILQTCSNQCHFHQQLIFNLMKDLASKTIILQQRNEIISKRSTKEKLMAYLISYAKRVNRSSFDIPFNRQELADYLAIDRSGLSAEISKLRKEGAIECHKNHFVLLNKSADSYIN